MSKILIFAEKPNVALKIATNGRKIFGDFELGGKILTKDYLAKNEKKLANDFKRAGGVENENYIITAAEGHLISLFSATDYDASYSNWRNIPYQYLPEEFKYKISPSREHLYRSLEKHFNRKDISCIYNAGDADREGELIFRLIYNQAGCNIPVKRIWINNQTEDDLIKSCKNMKDGSDYDNLGDAGYARAISDWVMGALLTAAATIKLSFGKEIINIGRVQTAVLAEIVRVEKLNKEFKSITYYNVNVKFITKDGNEYTGSYKEDFQTLKEAEDFIEKLNKEYSNGVVKEYIVNEEKVYSQPLYDQTALQMDMSNQYGLTPEQTLEANQSLYEHGHVSYPRTSSRYIMSTDVDDFNKMYKAISSINPLASEYDFNPKNKRIVNNEAVDGHGAIIPTYELPDLNSLTENERNLYMMIVKRTIAVNFPPAVDNKQKAITTIGDIEFSSSGSYEISKGWREVYDLQKEDNPLPELKVGEIVDIASFDKKEVVTKPPKRYTMATILNFMKNCGKKIENEDFREQMKEKGLGTGATRANILKSLEDNNYVTLKGKTLYPTEKAIRVIDILPVEELKSAEFTGSLEYDLHLISKGLEEKDVFLNKVFDLYKMSCEKIHNSTERVIQGKMSDKFKTVGKCPICGNNVNRINSKNGTFYACSESKNGCEFKFGAICSRDLTEKEAETLLKDKKLSNVTGLKKKDGKEMSAVTLVINEENKIKIDFSAETNSVGNCPVCGKPVAKRKGPYGYFYGCTGYSDGCRFLLPDNILGKKYTDKQIQTLLEKKQVGPIKGLTKKDGSELPETWVLLSKTGETSLKFSKPEK